MIVQFISGALTAGLMTYVLQSNRLTSYFAMLTETW